MKGVTPARNRGERIPFLLGAAIRRHLRGTVVCLIAGVIFALGSGCPMAAPSSGVSGKESDRSAGFGRRLEGDNVRLASWNVRNFFDEVDDANHDEVLSPGQFQLKVSELKAVLEELDADFVALQEVENVGCLIALNSSLHEPYPQLGLIEGNDRQRGIDVAFLSRLPVEKVVSHAQEVLPPHPDVSKNYRFSRDCLEVRLATEPPTTVLINHFKSSRQDAKGSAAKRFVQSKGAVAIAERVDFPEGHALLIVGDLNDEPGSWSLRPLFENYSDAFETIPKERRKTHRHGKRGSAIDHILLDQDAKAISAGAKIWSNLARDTSDHDPVSIELSLRPLTQVQDKVWVSSLAVRTSP